MADNAVDLTEDHFLGGRVCILQPRKGYRAATDPVFLAAAVPAVPGQSVLELGCGAGVASLCLACRVPGLVLAGVEVQAEYAELARRNAEANDVRFRIVEADLAALPAGLRSETFDHVMANPPYFRAGSGPGARDSGRETAQREATPLAVWIDVALRRARPGGWVTFIHVTERLPEILSGLDTRAGSISVLPLAARAQRPAKRVLVHARKGARGPFRLLAPLVVHEGSEHDGDRENFTKEARSILRDGASLDLALRHG